MAVGLLLHLSQLQKTLIVFSSLFLFRPDDTPWDGGKFQFWCPWLFSLKFTLSQVLIGFFCFQAHSNWHSSSLRTTLISLQLFVSFQECFILIVSIRFCTNFYSVEKLLVHISGGLWISNLCTCLPCISLCRWKYMSGYTTKSVESYIWCGCNFNIYTGKH
jgi:hypothetical protein